jgi:excisionase family DNA binding protein
VYQTTWPTQENFAPLSRIPKIILLHAIWAFGNVAGIKHARRGKMFTITEAASELNLTRSAVHRAIKQGRLEAERGEIIKIIRTKTKGWKISQKTLQAYRVSLLHQWVEKKIA